MLKSKKLAAVLCAASLSSNLVNSAISVWADELATINQPTLKKIDVLTFNDFHGNVLKDGKIHSIIHQTLTSTGRLSMSDPNLQNISIRKEEGKELRKAFFYDDSDYEFLSFDYSQIELRVMAALGNIKGLKEVCSMDEDIHKATASKVFGVPVDEVSGEMRRKAKTVNFGIVYGISAFGLAERLGCSRSDA